MMRRHLPTDIVRRGDLADCPLTVAASSTTVTVPFDIVVT